MTAQREVKDPLVAFTRFREEERFLKDSVSAVERSVEISLLKYKFVLLHVPNRYGIALEMLIR